MATKNRGFRSLVGGALGDLDYFPVAGISDNDASFGIVDGLQHAYFYDATLVIAANNSPYQIIPSDNATGTGAWVISGFQGPMSHMRAKQSSGQSIPNGIATTVIFDSEDEDYLSEYNTATGEFTAKYSGRYLICTGIAITADWSAGEGLVAQVVVDGSTIHGGKESAGGSLLYRLNTILSFSMDLVAGQVVRVDVIQNQGASQSLINDSRFNFLTIDRLV